MDKKFVIYKVTNILDNKIYIGCHKTYNINDSYMGSGVNIKKAIKENGLDKFKKEILFVYDNELEMLEKEKELVNREFIKREDTYNIIMGGSYSTDDIVVVKDSDGNTFSVNIEDPRYLSGELVGVTKGFFPAKDMDGNLHHIEKSDPRYLNGELVGISKGKVNVVDDDGNVINICKKDPRYLNGDLKYFKTGKVVVMDNNGDIFTTTKDDPRYLKGELSHIWKNKKHKEESKRKIGEANRISGIGERNSQYGTCWITKNNINKKIKKDDLDNYINDGWIKGRIMFN